MTRYTATTVPILLLVSVVSNSQNDQPFIQADVYNSLYDAYIQCDADFGQSRSEFIIERLENVHGQITIASLRKILNHKVEIAKQAIATKTSERESYLSEIVGADSQSERQPVDPADDDEAPFTEVRKIDAFLKEQRQYVKIHECVLEAL